MGETDRHTRESMFIIAIICVAYFGPNIFHGTGVGAADAATAFVGRVTLSGSNKYVATIKLGTPPQMVDLTLHTEAQITTISKAANYDFTKSSTYHSLLAGDLSTDIFTLNSTDGFVPTAPVQLNGILFKLESNTEGVLALGGGPMAFPTLVSAAGRVTWKFAYCLAGTFTAPTPIFFGNTSYYFDSGLGSGDRRPEFDITPYLTYTPLTLSPRGKHGYAVAITSIVVNQENGGVPADVNDIAAIGTESLYTSIVEPAYSQIRQAFLSVPVVAGSFPRVNTQYGPLDLCFNFTDFGLLQAAPLITFIFGGNASVVLTSDNYLVAVGDTGIYCFGLTSAGKERGSSVIGTFQQHNSLVEFDLQKQRLGMTGSLGGLRSNCGSFNFTAA